MDTKIKKSDLFDETFEQDIDIINKKLSDVKQILIDIQNIFKPIVENKSEVIQNKTEE